MKKITLANCSDTESIKIHRKTFMELKTGSPIKLLIKNDLRQSKIIGQFAYYKTVVLQIEQQRLISQKIVQDISPTSNEHNESMIPNRDYKEV